MRSTPRFEALGNLFSRQWLRLVLTLVPLVLALLHATGVLRLSPLQRLDDFVYDVRLRAAMPKGLDDRIVIVDIDEKSLSAVGRWPWSRNHVATLAREILDRQQAALLGFDVVFAEPDDSSGLRRLRQLAERELRSVPEFQEQLAVLSPSLDYDAQMAEAIKGRAVVLGYYFTSDRDGRSSGVLPAPVMERDALKGRTVRATTWDGYGSNIPVLADAVPRSGFFNAITDADGVVRAAPMLAEYGGRYYESLALAMFRMIMGSPQVEPGFPQGRLLPADYQGLESIRLRQGNRTLAVGVDDRVAALIPFRGPGGVHGGSFRYYSAIDVIKGALPADALRGRIVLVGTSAPGLLDMRVTPVGETYPGVETHANLIAGLLDGKIPVRPDYALGYEVVLLAMTGVMLAICLPLVSALRAVVLTVGVLIGLVGLNVWLFLGYGLVMPLASALTLTLIVFGVHMSYGYFVESRSKRELAHLFGTYVPPELVDEMVKDPDRYTMQAEARELTVMFCDMRGFTTLSEGMAPVQLQALLNEVFSRLTNIIRQHRGTVDKYMGDCVMAFWGAPVPAADHAQQATQAALAMAREVVRINEEHAAAGLSAIRVGIGYATGVMCVGDMGSDVRRSYTVIGDVVNLASRLEGLSKLYGVDIVASESARRQAAHGVWQELDRVRVKGKAEAVTIFTPLPDPTDARTNEEVRTWQHFLKTYREQDWEQAELHLLNLRRLNANKVLYQLYAERVVLRKLAPFDPSWDGTTDFDHK